MDELRHHATGSAGPRVLHVVQSGDRGGVQRHVRDLALGLPDLTCGVAAGTDGWLTDSVREAGMAAQRLPSLRRSLDPRCVAGARRELAALVSELHPDLVHAHGVFAFLAAIALERPVVYTAHGFQWHDPSHPAAVRALSRALHRRFAPRVALFIAVAGEAEEAQSLGFRRAVRIANGVPRPAERREEPVPVSMGTVGRLVAGKGVEDLLDVLRAVPQVALTVAGDGALSEQLRQRAVQMGVAERLELLGWRDDLGDFYSGLTLYVSLSRKEGLPYGVLDAMAAGLPLVLSDIPGHRELVPDGRNGILVPVGDLAGAAEAVRQVVADAELRRAMGAAGRQLALERFDLEQMLRGYRAAYASLKGLAA